MAKTKIVELTTRQVQEINNQTGNGRFNAQQQSAILEAIKVALNPDQYSDDVAETVPAVDQAAEEKAQQERDARAVANAQAQARALEEAEARPNVLNQGNVDSVTESTREVLAQREAARAAAEAATAEETATKTTAAKKVK